MPPFRMAMPEEALKLFEILGKAMGGDSVAHEYKFSHYEFSDVMSTTAGPMRIRYAVVICAHCGDYQRKQAPI